MNVALLAGVACDELQRLIERDRHRVVRWATTVVLLLVVAVPAGAHQGEWGTDHAVGRLVRRPAVAAGPQPGAIRKR